MICFLFFFIIDDDYVIS